MIKLIYQICLYKKMTELTLRQALRMMFLINQNGNFNSFFEGKGNGDVGFIVESKLITIGGKNGKN
jgi:hypothetical protein